MRRIAVLLVGNLAAWPLGLLADESSGMALDRPPPRVLPEITVQAVPEDSAPSPAAMSPGGIGADAPVAVDVPGGASRLDDALAGMGWASWDASNSLGLGAGLNVRGFTLSDMGAPRIQASHVFLDGHADIAWMYVRDAATVESVQLLAGSDATLLGAATPGGALLLRGKAPTGRAFARVRMEAANNGLRRLVLDAERAAGPVQLRGVLVQHTGDQGVEGVTDRHRAALLSARLPVGAGALRLDLEDAAAHLPFPFGAFYQHGHFWLDTPYVDARHASADRYYQRQALAWRGPVGDAMELHAHLQNVHSTRDEVLLGAWGLGDGVTAPGYYRPLQERNRQRDAGLRLDGHGAQGLLRHQWSVAWSWHEQRRRFSGPQNIGGFQIDMVQPVFPDDPGALPLAPRFAFQTYRESGLGVAWRSTWQGWELRAGARRSAMRTWSAAQPEVPLAQVQEARPLTHAWALGRELGTGQRLWLSRAQSVMPNIGQFSDGRWLPESRAVQWELGWRWQPEGERAPHRVPNLAALLFHIDRSNLSATDPADRDYFILRGNVRARGVQVRGGWPLPGGAWLQGAATAQHVRAHNGLGRASHVAGVPHVHGALRLDGPALHGAVPWVRVVAASHRPGDAGASFRAPGFGVVDVGVRGQAAHGLAWGLALENAADRRYVRALTSAENIWQGTRRRVHAWVEHGG
jgi:outer membrane receptor protein involved in Fe transport